MNATTLAHWISTAPRWEPAALGLALLVALVVAWRIARAVGRGVRSAMHGLDDGDRIDPFTGAVTMLATGLSVDGMWRVFGLALHLPTVARIVSCAVLELLCFAFMRLARKDILAKRSAKAHVITVWAVATLSACLSAASSASLLEVVVRFAFPLLAVHLLHSWFLPIPSEITLTQLQQGKRAWRFVKATRRVERAGNPASKWAAGRLLDVESDRLTKRSLMTGDASAVLAASERIAVGEALAGLGIRPERAVEPQPGVVAVPAGVDEEVNAPDGPPPVPGHAEPVDAQEPVPAPVNAKVDAETAKSLMIAGWFNGDPVSTTVARTGRGKSYVYRQYKALDDRHGARPRTDDDTGETPAVTAANGYAVDAV